MEQEISLREIIETILRGKWIIIIVTITAMLISGIISFLILPTTYETNSLVKLQKSTEKESVPLDLNSFVELLKSDISVNRYIENLKLDPTVYSIETIRSKFLLNVDKDSGVMKIKVKDEEPQLITDLANLLAYELGSRIEITEISQQVIETQKKLMEITDKITVAKSELTEAQNQLKSIPEKQVTKQTLVEDAIIASLLKESTNARATDMAGLQLESETTNPVYNALQSRVAEASINLTSLQTEEQTLKSRVEKNTTRVNQLDQLLEKEKLSTKQADRLLNGNQAVFISPAIMPTVPVGPNRLLNIIIGAIIGGMISIMIVFFRHYMNQTSKPLNDVGE